MQKGSWKKVSSVLDRITDLLRFGSLRFGLMSYSRLGVLSRFRY